MTIDKKTLQQSWPNTAADTTDLSVLAEAVTNETNIRFEGSDVQIGLERQATGSVVVKIFDFGRDNNEPEPQLAAFVLNNLKKGLPGADFAQVPLKRVGRAQAMTLNAER